jgi:hypothetical protein
MLFLYLTLPSMLNVIWTFNIDGNSI